MTYNSLTTGETYKLSDLFSNDNKIIIPDLQRDYCWGTTQNKSGEILVKAFLSNLIANYLDSQDINSLDYQDKVLNLGLLYGYEAPLGHIQLCDGQQRITTLFLLLGMVNKKTNDAFRRYLISETEEDDDWEPYLQYAIRESSLYFLSDLTRLFFIEGNDLSVSEIKLQSWYFKDYDLDPSIQNMIASMEIIEEEIKAINCLELGQFIIEKLSFLYYDMENRTKGEETFVVINTTGEPLSATENLKPLLISKQQKEKQKDCAQKWEKWEQFFWKNRGKNDTADNGLKEFFRWVMLLQQPSETDDFKLIQSDGNYKFDINIPFDDINSYFEIVSGKLFASENAIFQNREWLAPDINGNNQIVWFQLLPVLKYLHRYPKSSSREVWRVRMFFGNLLKIPRIKSDLYNRDINRLSNVMPDAIRIAKELPSKDICSMLQLENISKTIISDEVKQKLQILSNNPQRDKIEEFFWEEEKHVIWCGEIMPMLQWSMTENGFDFELFKNYAEKFNKVFHDTLKYEELDITRRALLTRDLKDYPRYFKGQTNMSFAWEHEDWHTLIFDNIEQFKSFFDALEANHIDKAQNEMITNNPTDKDYDEFVKIPELLKYCEQKKIQWWGKNLGWTLIKGDRASGEHANLKSYRLYLELKRLLDRFVSVWYYGYPDDYKNSCVVIDETQYRNTWAIDLWHSGNDNYALQIFRRDKDSEKSFDELIKQFDLYLNEDRYEKRDLKKEDVINLAKNIVDFLKQ